MGDSVIIPHVIGTAALLVMFFTVGTYYDWYFTDLSREAYRVQLGQVADYISSNIVDLVTLGQLTDRDQFLTKEIEIPRVIADKLYNISLLVMTPSYGDNDVIRVLVRIDSLDIYASSDMPWSANSNIHICNNQTINNITVRSNLLSDAAASKAAQEKKPAKIVVCCLKTSENFAVGLGVRIADKS